MQSTKFRAVRQAMVLIAGTLLLACSTYYVDLKETRLEEGAWSRPYQKLLVIGVTANENIRETFENIFSETLRKHGVAAVASYTLLEDIKHADSSRIQQLARQVDADAVIITRVLSRSEHTDYQLATGHVEQRTAIKTTSEGNSSTTVAMSAVGIVPGEMDAEGATLQTRMFDAASAKLAWSALSHAAGQDNDKANVCWKLSALLTKAMSEGHLIEINAKSFHQPKI